MTPDDVVQGFATYLAQCVAALQTDYKGALRDDAISPLMLHPRDEGLPVRSGNLAGLGSFTLHGFGCRIETTEGALVDFDWGRDGRPIFDVWRLWNFANSLGGSEISKQDLDDAARRSPLIEAVDETWFALVEW